MRKLVRIALAVAALALGAGSLRLQAQSQDPEPAPVATSESAAAPAPVDQVVVAPADEAPAETPEQEELAAAPVVEGVASTVVETAPLEPPPPAALAVDTSASDWPPTRGDEPARGQKGSDWIFLGIVALAVGVILARLTREREESVSIRDDRVPPSSTGPPIVRRS